MWKYLIYSIENNCRISLNAIKARCVFVTVNKAEDEQLPSQGSASEHQASVEDYWRRSSVENYTFSYERGRMESWRMEN